MRRVSHEAAEEVVLGVVIEVALRAIGPKEVKLGDGIPNTLRSNAFTSASSGGTCGRYRGEGTVDHRQAQGLK